MDSTDSSQITQTMTNKHTRRKWIKTVGGAAVGSALAGCTRGGANSSNNTTENTSTTSQSSVLDVSAYRDASIDWKAYEGTSINLGAVQHAWVDNIKPYVPIFEELTGIDVIWSILPEQQFRTKRLTDVSTGAGNFDLFFMDQVVNQFARAGWIKNLDSYFQSDSLFDDNWYNQNGLLQVCRQAAHGAGRQRYWTGLPITVEVQTMFYRKDLYEKYGLSVPKTNNQFLKNAKTIHTNEPGVVGVVNRGQKGYGMNIYTMDPWIREYGGNLWQSYPENSGLDTETAMKAGRFYVDTLQKYGSSSAATMEWSQMVATMQQGGAGHILNDANLFWGDLSDPSSSKFANDIAIAKMPVPKGKDTSFVPGAFVWQLSTSPVAANPEAAFLFMIWATAKPTQRAMAIQGSASFPVRRSIWESEPYRQKYGANFADVSLESLKSAKIEPFDPQYPVWGQKYSIQLQQAIAGNKSVEAAFEKAAEQAELTAGSG